jgi:hypothetical protein
VEPFCRKKICLLALILAFTLFGCIASLQSGLTVDDARNSLHCVYFNEFGRFLDIDSLFETDYWGISAREHARVLQIDSRFGLKHQQPAADRVDCAQAAVIESRGNEVDGILLWPTTVVG